MNKRFSWLSFKKMFIILIAILILAALIYMFMVYRYVNHSKVADKDAVTQFVKEASVIEKVTDLDYFTDEESYDIVYGIDADDKKYIAFNPNDNHDEDELTVVKLDDVLSKEKVEKNWQSSCDGCTLKKSGPAMLEDQALWELTYLDQKERYVMEYISLKDGSTYEKLRLNKKYR